MGACPNRSPVTRIRQALGGLASLEFTCLLFVLAMVLVFAGTLAQASVGRGQAVSSYFHSALVWIDLQLFVPVGVLRLPGSFPFPGGLTLASLMLCNLIAAHAMRFGFSRKRLSMIVLHAGVGLLLIGELITMLGSVEGTMRIVQGGSSNYIEDTSRYELVIIWPAPHDRQYYPHDAMRWPSCDVWGGMSFARYDLGAGSAPRLGGFRRSQD